MIPGVLAGGYYGFFATDVYVSESRFLVRGPQAKGGIGVEALFMGAMGSRAPDEASSVHDYVLSRDGLRVLNEAMDLRKAFGNERIFVLSRFPWLDGDSSFEALFRYYLTKVSFNVEPVSGICVLTTSAFDRADALRMNQILVEASERFVNELSKQSREDIVSAASQELRMAEERATKAALSLTEFKKTNRIMDIERQSGLHLELASRLYDELIATRAQIEQIRDVSSMSPQLKALEKKTKILKEEMDSETGLVLGGDSSLVGKAMEYERLMLNKGYAEKAWAAALAFMDSAKIDAQRKQMYVQRVVEPGLPDQSFEPRRIYSTVQVVVMGVLVFLLLSVFSSGVREHQER
jgi:capsular polysaccharide transport system permease protein